MKIRRARVTNFKSIDDSGWVEISDVISMVGKNESGKTAFLQALRKLNPIEDVEGSFDIRDYPRKGYIKYKRQHDAEPAIVVQAEFELSAEEMSKIETLFGKGIVGSNRIGLSKNYKNVCSWDIDINNQPDVTSSSVTTIHPAFATIAQAHPDIPEPTTTYPNLKDSIISECLESFLPKFAYFDNYSTMRGRISIQDLQTRAENGGPFDDADRTFISLLNLVGANLDDLEHQLNYEEIKAELESASINISDEIFEYWQQNRQLKVEFDLSQANPSDPPPLNTGTILHVRVYNERHRVSVPFDDRSKGFVWFFSFLAYFSQLEEEQKGDMVLLLDEPGTNLHAMAQQDFLRFIDQRLATRCQVIYTTHSPFMISLDNLYRVRTVQDMDGKGTVVSPDAVNNDQDTVFPLQMALGYQLAHTLFLAPHCLMVNAASDLIYMQVLKEMMASNRGMRLDPRWIIMPVGNADNLPTFISLLGENYVSVAVMMDITPTHKERLDRINLKGGSPVSNPIKWVEVRKVRDADIEDLFDPSFFLDLVNLAYKDDLPSQLTMRSITDSNPRIVHRISSYFKNENIAGGVFDTHRPAAYLLEHYSELQNQISEESLKRVSTLFERINALLPNALVSSSKIIDLKATKEMTG